MGVSEILSGRRDEILRIATRHGATRVQIFGSVARGEADESSDVDFLVEAGPRTSAWFPGGLIADLEDLLGRRVDVAEFASLHPSIRARFTGSGDAVNDDALLLTYIADALARIADYTQNGREEFLAEPMRQDAVLRNLQTMVETMQRLSAEVKASAPDVDWRGIAAFRNVLTHGYLSINLKRIWETISRDLPPSAAQIAALRQKDARNE